MTNLQKYEVSDLSEVDKVEARKHIAWMQGEIGVRDLNAKLPVLGNVCITVNGTIYPRCS